MASDDPKVRLAQATLLYAIGLPNQTQQTAGNPQLILASPSAPLRAAHWRFIIRSHERAASYQ